MLDGVENQHNQPCDTQSILNSIIYQNLLGLNEQLEKINEQLGEIKEVLRELKEDTAKNFSALGVQDKDSNSSTTTDTTENNKNNLVANVEQTENDIATNAVPSWLDRCIAEVSQLFSKMFVVHAKLD